MIKIEKLNANYKYASYFIQNHAIFFFFCFNIDNVRVGEYPKICLINIVDTFY